MFTTTAALTMIAITAILLAMKLSGKKKSLYPTLDNSVQFQYERYQAECLKVKYLDKKIDILNHEISELKIDNGLQYQSAVATTIANLRLSRAFAKLAHEGFLVLTDSELVDENNPIICFATKEECFPLKKHSWYSPDANIRVEHKGQTYYSRQKKISPMLTTEMNSVAEAFKPDTNNNVEDSLHD
jgi:hypothetical protein